MVKRAHGDDERDVADMGFFPVGAALSVAVGQLSAQCFTNLEDELSVHLRKVVRHDRSRGERLGALGRVGGRDLDRHWMLTTDNEVGRRLRSIKLETLFLQVSEKRELEGPGREAAGLELSDEALVDVVEVLEDQIHHLACGLVISPARDPLEERVQRCVRDDGIEQVAVHALGSRETPQSLPSSASLGFNLFGGVVGCSIWCSCRVWIFGCSCW
ncbi:hypothetical protein [Amycolatopsis sp. FDAARGOS 1241]|uniref:hypothetical protein n=1 Tax=Amycolatopsis sp. FDAARGOS 1241 TaxID=2778070 RepID=UPI00194F54F3|nr:hypothetical protein [Amycolatopsis sp. FDAARGOS 1241]QRP46035.1 hypothetical protein I6J71_44470 [Amycolatopsis sp. FDAARGOS 1241]